MATPTTPSANSTTDPSRTFERELQVARDAALAAGEILQRYFRDGGYQIDSKGRNNPVTTADFEADSELKQILRDAFPAYGWLSEETADNDDRLTRERVWIVDPLDGTKEFIKKNGEFTVNIALIEGGRPTLGIVLAPASETLWRGAAGLGADKSEHGGAFTPITTRPEPTDGLTCCASRSHAIYSDLDIWFGREGLTVAERVQVGSSLKFCLIAEGKADIYPRFGPTNEWDTAAGQGVLEAAGGEVVTTDGKPLLYGKPRFSNPHFIARSKALR
jgi:3'(2'), 5'-bisphosphate nucleotidase